MILTCVRTNTSPFTLPSTSHSIRVAISTGDPLGIGPEICRAVIARPPAGVLPVTFGTLETWPGPHTHRADAGRASFDAFMQAIDAVKRGDCHAMCTAPVSKEAWHAAGVSPHPGHTEVLGEAFESPLCGMLFVGPSLRVILTTVHVPLSQVPGLLTRERVRSAIRLCHRAMLDMGIDSPRIAVAGLNPHAGEGGLLGLEDTQTIAPAINDCRAEGINAIGPCPGDTVFSRALVSHNEFDAVVAMYHDQGLIPVKLIDGRRTVNTTVGLLWQGRPVVRTSPAHGTAFDAVGKGDATSMEHALALAARMVAAASARSEVR